MKADEVVAVVGLGYVGLPLAVEFGKKVRTIGFDLSSAKIENYKKFIDPTGEVTTEQLQAARQQQGGHGRYLAGQCTVGAALRAVDQGLGVGRACCAVKDAVVDQVIHRAPGPCPLGNG